MWEMRFLCWPIPLTLISRSGAPPSKSNPPPTKKKVPSHRKPETTISFFSAMDNARKAASFERAFFRKALLQILPVLSNLGFYVLKIKPAPH